MFYRICKSCPDYPEVRLDFEIKTFVSMRFWQSVIMTQNVHFHERFNELKNQKQVQ